MKRLIERVGPLRLSPSPEDTFEALLESIVHQQLHTKVAATIHGRVMALFEDAALVTPELLLKIPDELLRGAGLSRAKLAAMRDLAEKCRDGMVPRRAELEKRTDEEIIARLTAVRGIGVWTAQMFLIFRLGRPDVMPSGDFGVRKAFGLLYRKNGRVPPASALEKHAEIWAPYRTVASWYLWRSLDAP
ncbi:MAG TPA: DNA-3-methyladenine glycosylase 2 family protein [Elusimicrobiota bacterium]|nr:DNA-3-methyladenine glycosylase 2 family protein [Elusimicrobiota bacterium]